MKKMKKLLALCLGLCLTLGIATTVCAEDAAGSSVDNPIIVYDISSEIEVSAEANSTVYYQFWGVGTKVLTLKGETVSLTYDGKTYGEKDGVITMTVSTSNPRMPLALSVTNLSDAAAKYALTFASPVGAMDNPEVLDADGDKTAKVPGYGNAYFYSYTAPADGEVTVTMKGENWTFNVDNTTQGTYGDIHFASDAVASEKVTVKKGDVLQVVIGTEDYMPGEIAWNFVGVEVEEPAPAPAPAPTPTPAQPASPKTGDTTSMVSIMVMMVVAACAVVAVVASKKRAK